VDRYVYSPDGVLMAKYYVTRIDLKIVDGKLTGTETILTKPSDEKAAHEGARRFRGLGTQNVHVVKHVAKRFKKLMREQNKRRKANPLTVADIAQMTEQAENELTPNP
jgi:hypothetical protein